MGARKKAVIAILVIAIMLIVVYAVIPSIVAKDPSQMKSGQNYYLYGKIVAQMSSTHGTAFIMNDSGFSIIVTYNGSIPAVGASVLINGEFLGNGFFDLTHTKYFQATSVTEWYF